MNLKISISGDLSVVEGLLKRYERVSSHTSDSETIVVTTDRSDVVDHFKKFLKSARVPFRIYLRDSTGVLEGVYLREEGTQYYEIPPLKWSSLFYSRFKDYVTQSTGVKSSLPVQREFHLTENSKKALSQKEVNRRLVEENWIYPIQIPGHYLYGPSYISLENALAKLYEEVVLRNSADRYKFSHLIPLSETLKTNYFYSVCPNLHFHLKLTDSVPDLKKMRVRARLEHHLDPKEFFNHTSGVHYVMNYCSCQGLWLAFQNHDFEGDFELVKFYDRSTPTYRDEKGKVVGLERLEIFERFEYVFLGRKDLVLEQIEETKKRLIAFLSSCNLSFSVVKTSSWYMEDESSPGYTLDFEYQGEERVLEIGNLSYNSSVWTKPYNVTFNHRETHNACSGLGIQRLIYLFLINNGFNREDWPPEVQKYLNDSK